MTRIMVVDDHTILRQGVAGLLRSVEGFEVVAEAGTGAAAVRLASDLKPDVVLMDMSLPDMDGLEAFAKMKGLGLGCETIFLTMHNDPGMHEAANRAGARGYILKDDAVDDLVYAIKAVMRGERYTSGSLRSGSDETSCSGGVGEDKPEGACRLTGRETEIVSLIADGLSSREIAERLFISIKTVETHRSHVLDKLGLRNTADIVKYAIRSGLGR